MVVAFIDLLGVRARWHEGGRASAEAAFGRLETMVGEALARLMPRTLRDGAIETDSAALVFGSSEEALAFIAAQRAGGGTNLYEALVVALSDGDAAALIAAARLEQRGARWVERVESANL